MRVVALLLLLVVLLSTERGEVLQMSEPLVNLSGPGSVFCVDSLGPVCPSYCTDLVSAARKVVITARSIEVMVIIL